MRIPTGRFLLPMAMAAALSLAMPSAATAGNLDCRMTFSMSGWSAFYKTGSGTGTVSCDNGDMLDVRISTKGGGLTFGKMRIDNGSGEFSGIDDIAEVLGVYIAAEAHAGASKSAGSHVMTKGDVSLALAGKGRGWDLGVSFGKFIIKRR